MGMETVKELVDPYLKTGRNITLRLFLHRQGFDVMAWEAGLDWSWHCSERDKRFLPDRFKHLKNFFKSSSLILHSLLKFFF